MVVEVGPGFRTKEGSLLPPTVKKGDRVLLPEYGGNAGMTSIVRMKHSYSTYEW